MQSSHKTKQILVYLFLLCFAFISNISAQPSTIQSRIGEARLYFDNGNYSKAIEIAQATVEEAKKADYNLSSLSISESLQTIGDAQIFLQKYNEAEKSLNDALLAIPDNEANTIQKARIYLDFALLFRSQRKFSESLNYLKKAITQAPTDKQILAEYNLNVGRILFTSGYDVSAIIWLEKAEKLFAAEKTSPAKLDVYRFLALAWWSKLNYQTALKYTQKWESEARNTRFKQKYRQALLDSATILSESGQQMAALRAHEKGLKLALADDNQYQAGIFLTSLLLNSLDNDEVVKASAYLEQLEKINEDDSFSFEILLGKAIISAYKNETEKSSKLFSQLDKMENSSEFILPGWRVKIAKRNKDWKQLIEFNQKLLDLTVENNFRDELPAINLDFARAYFNLNQLQLSAQHLEKSLAFIEEIRQAENTNLSLGLSETYHNAYRLLAQIKFKNPQESFELADFLKARLLKDRIDNAAIKYKSVISPTVRKTLEELSLKYIDDQSTAREIERQEKLVTNAVPELNIPKPSLTELDKVPDLDHSAIVSYFFTLDKKLTAFVREKGKPIQITNLSVSEMEADALAKSTEQKINLRRSNLHRLQTGVGWVE
jgi:tetratricopeptide (TPR) repeat protein